MKLRTRHRAIKAFLFPCAWLDWVNSERCYLELHNDPSGQWTLKIGNRAQPPVSGRSLHWLCWQMFWELESDPDWTWTTDWFRQPPKINAT